MTRERLYRAYIEELKFFNPILRTQTNKDILANYKEVSSFEDLFWFDIYDGPEVVGFLLVANGTHCTKDADYMIMELYVHPNHREKGLAKRAVLNLFHQNPGTCGLFVLNLNIDAQKFWNRLKGTKELDIKELETNKQYDNEWTRYHLWSVKENDVKS